MLWGLGFLPLLVLLTFCPSTPLPMLRLALPFGLRSLIPWGVRTLFYCVATSTLTPLCGVLVSSPAVVYAEFLALTTGMLERCGAYRPSSLPGKRKVQPLWWNSECDDAIARKRDALRRYTACQTREERVLCKRIDDEVKRFLRREKQLSFVVFCESIDPSVGLTRIWRTVRSLSSRASGGRMDRCSD